MIRSIITATNRRKHSPSVKSGLGSHCSAGFTCIYGIFFFFTASQRPISFLWTSPENRCGNCCVARRSPRIARIGCLILIEWAAVFSALGRVKKPLGRFIPSSNCNRHSYTRTWESECSEEGGAGTRRLFLRGPDRQGTKEVLFVLEDPNMRWHGAKKRFNKIVV